MNFLEKIDKIKEKYLNLQKDLQDLGEILDKKILQYLYFSKNIDINRIITFPKHRVKEIKSVINNIIYRKSAGERSNLLVGLHDKVGTRIVVLTENDVKKVADILLSQNDCWDIRIGRELDKKPDNSFDYKAIHLYVTPKQNMLPQFSQLSKKKLEIYECEIQIRTNLQHTLSIVQHDVTYKNVYKFDGELSEKLANAYEMIEKIDNYIWLIYNSMENNDIHIKEFYTEIANIYSQFNRRFVQNSKKVEIKELVEKSDKRLNALIFSIYEVEKIKIDDIETVCKLNYKDVDYLVNSNIFLTQEPIIILIAYLCFKKRNTLKIRWFLSDDILQEIFHKLGFAYDNE